MTLPRGCQPVYLGCSPAWSHISHNSDGGAHVNLTLYLTAKIVK